MIFVLKGNPVARQGRLSDQHPASKLGAPVLLDEEGLPRSPAEVAWVIPDDEGMAETVRRAGYAVHTPMSQHIGLGATMPGEP
jgi:hypothetical protein